MSGSCYLSIVLKMKSLILSLEPQKYFPIQYSRELKQVKVKGSGNSQHMQQQYACRSL